MTAFYTLEFLNFLELIIIYHHRTPLPPRDTDWSWDRILKDMQVDFYLPYSYNIPSSVEHLDFNNKII